MGEITISSSARWFNSSESTILLNAASGRYHWLNQTGTAIWLAIVEGMSLLEAETHLMNQYGLSDHRAHLDVEEIVTRLLEAGLLMPVQDKL